MASGELRSEWVGRGSWQPARRLSAILLLAAGALVGAGGALVLTRSQRTASGEAAAAPEGPVAATPPAAGPAAGRDAGTGSGPATVPLAPRGDGYASIAKAVMPAVVNVSSVHVIRTYERYSP